MEERQPNPQKPKIPTQPNPKKPEITYPVEPIITSNCLSIRQLNLLSILNKEWQAKDSESRREVLVSNVWAIAPHRVIERFPNLHSIVLVNPIPRILDKQQNRGLDPTADSFRFWHMAALKNHKLLERLTLRQISITDEDLKSISTDYPKFKALTLISCTGFSIIGIEAVAANCRNLVHLVVRSCTVTDSDSKGDLLTLLHADSLVSLEMSAIKGVKTCIGDPRILLKFLKSAARLEHLGVVVNMKGQKPAAETCKKLSNQLEVSRKLESLSLGCSKDSLLFVPGCYIQAFQPVASQIISLNIRDFVSGDNKDQTGLIKNCINLRILQACSFYMNDDAIRTIGKHCTKLEKVKLLDSLDRSGVSENGLKYFANGYLQLKSLSVCVKGMTCESLVFFAKHKRNIECFKLYVDDSSFFILGRGSTGILDQGFVTLLQLCQKLERLRASNVSNELFSSIAGNNLKVLIVKVAEAAVGKTPYLGGLARSCPRLERLGIEDCWFPSLPKDVFLTKVFKCLWMKSYNGCIDLGECRKVSNVWRDVNVHVVKSTGQHDLAKVFWVYTYKTCVPGQSFFQ